MSPLRTNSIRNLSYVPQDGLFSMADFQQELLEHYSRAMEREDLVLAFDILRELIRLQYPLSVE